MSAIFPSEFDATIFSANGVQRFAKRVENFEEPLALIQSTDYELRHTKLGSHFMHAALAIEPYETASVGYDVAHQAASSYYMGSMFAMGGLWRMLSASQRIAMSNLALPERTTTDTLHSVSGDREVFLGIGRLGFAGASMYHEVFSEYEDEISATDETIGATRAGFGLPFYLISIATKAELAEMANSTDSIAWDLALQELTGSQES